MTLETEVQSLRKIPIFEGIDTARLKLLAFASEYVVFAPGQRFFSEGDPADAAFVILSGHADVVIDNAGSPFVVAEIGQNAVVGEMGLLSDRARSAAVVATEETAVLRIDKRVFLELLSQFPQMSFAVLREVATRLERTTAQLARLKRATAQ